MRAAVKIAAWTQQSVEFGLPDVNLGEIEALLVAHPLVAGAKAELQNEPDGLVKIVAWVVPAANAYDVPQSLMTEYTETWRRVHDAKYEQPPSDPMWDTGVWIDSYRMEPIPQDEMRRWTNETVARILRLRPRRILEIGCGSGLLLYRLAPHCEKYVGLDFSERVIARLAADIERRPAELQHVKVLHREAQDLDDFIGGNFDLVVINSVVMYLPTAAYLELVLDRAMQTLSAGGRIFVGDVRDRSSAKHFHLSVALAGLPANSNAEQLRATAARGLSIEKQLLLPPSFFTNFAARHPRIVGVRIDLKQGSDRNEMNRFRFDATLSTAPASGADTIETVDGEMLGLDEIRQLLSASPKRRLKICGLSNARLEFRGSTIVAPVQRRAAQHRRPFEFTAL